MPIGVRNNPAWIFIGMLFVLSGIGLLTGLSDPSAISNALPQGFLYSWAVIISLGGAVLVYATMRLDVVLERLVLRVLSTSLLVYGGWAVYAVGFTRAAMTVGLVLILIGIFEVRVAVIKLLLRPYQPPGVGDESS